MTEAELNGFTNLIKYRLATKFPSTPAFSAVTDKLNTGKKIFDDSYIKQAVKEFLEDPVKALETYADIVDWENSAVTDMSELFKDAENFDDDISEWETCNVKGMEEMFYGAWMFDQDIGAWDTSNVKNMSYMFYCAMEFNKNIGAWDVSNVENMQDIFSLAKTFNIGYVQSWTNPTLDLATQAILLDFRNQQINLDILLLRKTKSTN